MQTMHPTLLIGPGDWLPQHMPLEEYEERRAALWRDHRDAGGAIVYGDSSDHAALAYLTHFTPKLEPALALIPRHGAPQMLIGGGVNMLPAAKPLTFIPSLLPLRDAARTAAAWAQGLAAGTEGLAQRLAPDASLVLIGGDAMPNELRLALDRALGDDRRLEAGDAALQTHMRHKSPRELFLLREACAMLDATVAVLRDAVRGGQGVTDCIVRAERAALRRGAKDIRSLFSLDGGRTLRPFDVPIARHCDPLQVYLALCHDGYWAEGFVRIAPPDDALQQRAETTLRAMLAEARPGVSVRRLQEIADAGRGAFEPHPLAEACLGNGIGLSLDEPPLRRGGVATLEAGDVYSLRAGLCDRHRSGAVLSAMVALTAQGAEMLWPIGSTGEPA